MKLLSKIKNRFHWDKAYALEPVSDDDEIEEGWQEHMADRQEAFGRMDQHLLEMRQSSLEKSDELTIALSSAFLALSIGFIKEIVPLERSILMWVLVTSWICFFGATAVNFFSHSIARRAIENNRECNQRYHLEGRVKYIKPEFNKATRATEKFNNSAAILLGVGLVLTLIFVSVNVVREQSYQVKKESKSGQSSK